MVKIDVTFIAEGLERNFFVGKSSRPHLVCLSRNDFYLTRNSVHNVELYLKHNFKDVAL